MKKLLSLSICLGLALLILATLTLSGFAAYPGASLSGNPLVVDNAGLLSESERAALERSAKSISQAHGCEVIIVTVNSTGGKSAQDYADDYFWDHNYGVGENRDGILFLLDMGERDWHVATHGSAISAFPDDDIDFMVSRFLPDLSDGDYADAFESYHEYADKILGVADGSLSQNEVDALNQEFNAYMNGEEETREPNYVKKGIWSVILGALGGFIPASAQKSALKTVRKKRDAAGYAQEGSLNLYVNRDTYLFSNVTSHVIQRSESSGGSHSIGSGVSTTHSHSSGTSFGGHGGKF